MNSSLLKQNLNPKNNSESPVSKNTDENSAKSSTIQAPQISLPKGGGAIKGIDEKFTVNPATGTATQNIPIFTSGNRRARVSEKRIDYEKAGNAKKLMEDGLILENQQARLDFVMAYEKYLSEKENVKISNKILERTRIKVREGLASSLDFTQINNQYLTTESNYISAMVELLNAKIRLDKAMNRL